MNNYAGDVSTSPTDRNFYLAVGRQIKVNYVWAFLATFAEFKRNESKDAGRQQTFSPPAKKASSGLYARWPASTSNVM